MNGLGGLPAHLARMLASGVVAQFCTLSAEGIPIDTPTDYFPADDLATFDLAAGVVNPAKAEGVRWSMSSPGAGSRCLRSRLNRRR